MDADGRQVGGSHYRGVEGEQHWTRMWRLYGRGYFIGQLTRYAERYHLKNGIQDLDKIIHYAEKLKELEQAWADGTGPPPGETGAAPLPGVKYTRIETKPEPVTCSPREAVDALRAKKGKQPPLAESQEVPELARKPLHVWHMGPGTGLKVCTVCQTDYNDLAAYEPCTRITPFHTEEIK